MKRVISIIVAMSIILCTFTVSITAEKETVSKPISPIVIGVTADSVVLAYVNGYEYKMDDGEWQSINLFTDLEFATEYTFYQRVAETDTAYASEPSEGVVVKTDKTVAPVTAPPMVESYDSEYLYLVPTPGYEYKANDGKWQKSNRFSLTYGNEHRFYQRIAENDRYYAGPSSDALMYKPEKFYRPSLDENTIDYLKNDGVFIDLVDYNSIHCITSYVCDEFEFRLNDGRWSASIRYDDLSPMTIYTVYARYRETSTYYAGEEVELFKIRTASIAEAAEETSKYNYAPELYNKTETTIEIVGKSAQEYIITDTEGYVVKDWQRDTVFTGLEPDTAYIIYGRWILENGREGAVTKPLNVTTLKEGEIYYRDIGEIKLKGDGNVGRPVQIIMYDIDDDVDVERLTFRWYRNGVLVPDITERVYIPTIDDMLCDFRAEAILDGEVIGKAVSGVYRVADYLIGDVNGDMLINLTDVTMMLKYIAGWELDGFKEFAAHVDSDGVISLYDVTWVLKKIAGWNVK